MSTVAPLPAEGDVVGPRTFALTRADLVAYANASGDQNPIHQDEAVALAVGLPGVIAHGMLTLGLAARAVTDWFPGAEVVEFGSKFTNPVVVPAEGAAEVEFTAVVKKVETDDDGTRVSLLLTAMHDGTKVLGMPKALLRLR
ncbi:MaoC/PaaZ C-terminal domain-containing protein [Nocardioides yefusunii]|uniref:MaoC/PaaZ C-terminal domain-containing protein n=1 Tax=Nocardioides yefusunii TaxID=2500546 RepID=A0ABW1R1T9_9ACTN|nr:MaoC/PaaZ C-terminal domain-containing protein [Nocardioides yefusunii]